MGERERPTQNGFHRFPPPFPAKFLTQMLLSAECGWEIARDLQELIIKDAAFHHQLRGPPSFSHSKLVWTTLPVIELA